MDIHELIEEGQAIIKKKPKGGHYRDIPDKQRYYTWTNNIETFLESINFKQSRINPFKFYAANFRLDEIMGMLKSIEDNSPVAPVKKKQKKSVLTNKVFIVHGHNEAVKEKVARFVEHLKLEPIILHEQTDKGRTIIEKFEV